MVGFSVRKYWGILSLPPDVKILRIFYSLEEEEEKSLKSLLHPFDFKHC